jgi:hypothetical protein
MPQQPRERQHPAEAVRHDDPPLRMPASVFGHQPVEQVGVKLHPLRQPRRKTSVGTRDQVCEINRHGLEVQVGEDRAVHGHARKEQRDVS